MIRRPPRSTLFPTRNVLPIPCVQVQASDWRSIRTVVLARDSRTCRACGDACTAGEADVHHLIPRAAGGVDDAANLITLCDGCHAAHHPNLQGTLARRMIERWGLRLARWLDRRQELGGVDESLGAAMRLLGVTRFRAPQLEIVDRKSTRLNSSHLVISYAVFCLKKKK